MVELTKRVDKLETALIKHLLESGGIKTDLAWLKRAFWTLTGGGIAFNVALALAILAHFWR